MKHGFKIGERAEVVSGDAGHKVGAKGTIALITTKSIYVELDELPPEHLMVIILDPETNTQRILSIFEPAQLRHITIPSA
ncbi:MAG: hypothetical protein IPP13_22995 [Kouleothrix sp.]|jgi:hypothetical protein|nr:hypothetical protein [Kouleothrix sp.]